MGPRNSSQPSDTHGVSDAVARVRAYHQRTKHMPGRYAPGPGYMDWANQPDPFRRFSGPPMFEFYTSVVRPWDGCVSLMLDLEKDEKYSLQEELEAFYRDRPR